MGDVSELIDGIVMPTPAAVLKAAELLAGGAAGEEGLGQLVVIDIGGSTTDVHSIAEGRSAGANVIYEGLQEPYCKRTVEADIGMRYNAPNLMPDAHGDVSFSDPAKKGEKVRIELKEYEKYIDKVQKQVHYLPQSEKEMAIERCMARNAAMRAMSRHAGVLKTVYTPSGEVFVQRGKDLSAIGTVIGTGGILVNNNLPGFVLSGVRYRKKDAPQILAPLNPDFLLDRQYILAAAGLMADTMPEEALGLMKKYIVSIDGGI